MDRDDDDYAAFVADMWAADGIPLHDITVERGYSTSDRHSGQLVSLVEGRQGRLYVNVLEDGVRKTYRPEMHRWWRDGLPIHVSAFDGVRSGADPEAVLRLEYPARTSEEAASPLFNRFASEDAAYVIDYISPDEGYGWSVISKVLRQRDAITARSHFRFGHRQSFAHSNMCFVIDLPTVRPIALEDFLASKRKQK